MGPTRIARTAIRRARDAAFAAYGWCSFARSHWRPAPLIRERHEGGIALAAASRVAVFSHFDRRGDVREFVHHSVRAIHDAGYAVVFVSHAPRLDPAALERLRPVCGLIVRRDNVGWDFAAYRAGMEAVAALDRLDSLLLANDSVYGPFHDLGALLARMDMAEADVWGITDSWERHVHLQGYFVLFGRAAVASAAFARFWADVGSVPAKTWVISRYEIGLTRALTAGGLRCRALFPFPAALATLKAAPPRADAPGPAERRFLRRRAEAIEAGVPLNPTHFLWDTLIAMGCPFLKRELLRDNPVKVAGLERWEPAIRAVSDYDTRLIVQDLALSRRRRR